MPANPAAASRVLPARRAISNLAIRPGVDFGRRPRLRSIDRAMRRSAADPRSAMLSSLSSSGLSSATLTIVSGGGCGAARVSRKARRRYQDMPRIESGCSPHAQHTYASPPSPGHGPHRGQWRRRIRWLIVSSSVGGLMPAPSRSVGRCDSSGISSRPNRPRPMRPPRGRASGTCRRRRPCRGRSPNRRASTGR